MSTLTGVFLIYFLRTKKKGKKCLVPFSSIFLFFNKKIPSAMFCSEGHTSIFVFFLTYLLLLLFYCVVWSTFSSFLIRHRLKLLISLSFFLLLRRVDVGG